MLESDFLRETWVLWFALVLTGELCIEVEECIEQVSTQAVTLFDAIEVVEFVRPFTVVVTPWAAATANEIVNADELGELVGELTGEEDEFREVFEGHVSRVRSVR